MSDWGVILTSAGGLLSVVSVAIGRLWGIRSSTGRQAQLDLHSGLTALVKEYQESRLFEAKKASAEEKKRKEAQDELNKLSGHVTVLEGKLEVLQLKVDEFTTARLTLQEKYDKLMLDIIAKDGIIRELELKLHKQQLEKELRGE